MARLSLSLYFRLPCLARGELVRLYFCFEVHCTYQPVVSAHVRAHISSGMISDEPCRPRPQQNDPRGPPMAHLSIAFKSTHWVRAHVAFHSWSSPSHTHPWNTSHFAYNLLVVISHLCLPIDHVAVCSWSSDSHSHLSSMLHFVHGFGYLTVMSTH